MAFFRRHRAYLVHVYTASTLVFVVLGMEWVLSGDYGLALGMMAITILIDATDGLLARRFRVKETASGVDGALLDNIVDFLSYVALPMLFLLRAEMLLPPVTLWVSFVVFASAFGFSRTTAKLADKGFFCGVPVVLEHPRVLPLFAGKSGTAQHAARRRAVAAGLCAGAVFVREPLVQRAHATLCTRNGVGFVLPRRAVFYR